MEKKSEIRWMCEIAVMVIWCAVDPVIGMKSHVLKTTFKQSGFFFFFSKLCPESLFQLSYLKISTPRELREAFASFFSSFFRRDSSHTLRSYLV